MCLYPSRIATSSCCALYQHHHECFNIRKSVIYQHTVTAPTDSYRYKQGGWGQNGKSWLITTSGSATTKPRPHYALNDSIEPAEYLFYFPKTTFCWAYTLKKPFLFKLICIVYNCSTRNTSVFR